MNQQQNMKMGEAAGSFLTSLGSEEREVSQQAVYGFVRWFGWERSFSQCAAPDVAGYAQRLSLSDTDYVKKLGMVKAFLVYAKKTGWSRQNLSVHLKIRKSKARMHRAREVSPAVARLTQGGYEALQSELVVLKERRLQAIDEVRRAAADKDFRENAPLDAAREERSHLEGRIQEIEGVLKSATVVAEDQRETFRVGIGDGITLSDPATGEEWHYVLVDPKEVDPIRGKISSASPIGKVVLGKREGEVVKVTVPAGKLSYKIEKIER